ncbi:MAG: divalent-cation tolerance protein CutA [Gammaproteobacteria bacterium]|nr:MAG: divalent-cation tolerance protein CutA [Gammaproteobacteria bacterium]
MPSTLWLGYGFSMADQQIVLCTCPDRASAEIIATAVVERGLAACVNIVPDLTSIYKWQGKLDRASELLLLIKSTASVYEQLQQTIQSLHPYELPEIIAVPIEAGFPPYLNWIDDSCDIKT